MLVDFTHPLRNLSKGVSIGDVVSDNNTVSSLVITAGDSFKSLLSSSVPNLKLDSFSIDNYCSNLKVDSNGRHEIIVEDVVLVRLKIRGLTANLKRRDDFPTPEFPIKSTLKR